MPPPPRVLEDFYKTKTADEVEQSSGHLRSGFVRAYVEGTSSSTWQQSWAVLDAGGDFAVLCLCRGRGDVKPTTVLQLAHYSIEALDAAEAQGPTDFAFHITEFREDSAPLRHLFCVDSAEDRDTWVDVFTGALGGGDDGTTYTGFTGTEMTDATETSFASFASTPMPPPSEDFPAWQQQQHGAYHQLQGAPGAGSQTPAIGGIRTHECTVVREDGPTLGLHFSSRTEPGRPGKYYTIDRIEPGSVAASKGLVVGAELKQVQGQPTHTLDPEAMWRLMRTRPLHLVTTQHSIPPTTHIAHPSPGQISIGPAIASPRPNGNASQQYPSSPAPIGVPQPTPEPAPAPELRQLQAELELVKQELEEERRGRAELTISVRRMMSHQESLVAVNAEMDKEIHALRAQLQLQAQESERQLSAQASGGLGRTASAHAPHGSDSPLPSPRVRVLAQEHHQAVSPFVQRTASSLSAAH